MNTNAKILIIFGLLASGSQIAKGQGSFVNLDFESAIQPITPDGFYRVSTSSAIPGWTSYVGGDPVDLIYYNAPAIDAAGVNLLSPAYGYLIEGNYSVLLQSPTSVVPPSYPSSAAVGQVGTIPFGSQSLFFVASSGVLQVTFAGQTVPTVAVEPYSGFTLYGGDISMFAGQTGELLFTVSRPSNGNRQDVLLDSISFSTTGVPEPTTLSLLGLGLLGWGWHRRRSFHA